MAELVEFSSVEGEQRYAALVRASADALVGLDFDGTLAPIVDQPQDAHIHRAAGEVLVALAEQVAAVAVITGRPVRQALELGGLEEIGTAIGEAGKELYVFGQYGNERWSSTSRRVVSPRPPVGLASFLRDLPALLRRVGGGNAYVEEKGLAVAVHTRRLEEPDETFDALIDPVRELAARHDLAIEPGRHVIEVRSPGMHKGVVVERLVDELAAGGVLYAGDDLGDVEAFEAVARLAKGGLPTLLVCAESQEQSALVPLADVVVPGPDGVLDLLRQLTADAARLRA